MKAKIFRIIMAAMISTVCVAGCGLDSGDSGNKHEKSDKTDKDEDDKDTAEDKEDELSDEYNRIREFEGSMFGVRNENKKYISPNADCWMETQYIVNYDGTITVDMMFSQSGKFTYTGELSKEDYMALYSIGARLVLEDKLDQVWTEDSDIEEWTIRFADEYGEVTEICEGAIEGIDYLEDIAAILLKYEAMVECDTPKYMEASSNDEWKTAYCDYLAIILNYREANYEYNAKYGYYDSMDSEFPNYYYVYDITGDGMPELVVRYGSCEADYTDMIYSYEVGGVANIGFIYSGHSAFYTSPEGGIIRQMSHMGYNTIELFTYSSGDMGSIVLLDESGYDDNGEFDMDFVYTDAASVVNGATQILYEDLKVTDPIMNY